jgi:hypothetical protein
MQFEAGKRLTGCQGQGLYMVKKRSTEPANAIAKDQFSELKKQALYTTLLI